MRSDFKEALRVFVPLRIATWFFSQAVVTAYEFKGVGIVHVDWFRSWIRADSLRYISIAENGYSLGSADPAFFPFYPLLIKTVHLLVPWVDWEWSAILVSNAAFVAALAFFRRWVKQSGGTDEVAKRSLWLLALTPGGCFFFAAYTESVFLACVLGAWVLFREKRWVLSATLAVAASATRNGGFILAAPLAWETFVEWRKSGAGKIGALQLKQAAVAMACFGGLVLFSAFCAVKFGAPFAWVQAQSQGWGKISSTPVHTLFAGLWAARVTSSQFPGGFFFLDFFGALLPAVVGIWVAWKSWRRRAYGTFTFPVSAQIYLWLSWLPPLMMVFPSRPLASVLRYAALLFPVAFGLAQIERWREAVFAISAIAFTVCMALFLSTHYFF